MTTKHNAIRTKNAAFDRLVNADRLCRRRRHTTGDVPPSWVTRLAELRREYREAVLEVRQ